MAIWKRQIAGTTVVIRNVDHGPPHCHAVVDGYDAQIELYTLSVLHPPPHKLPPALRS
jgi:hypothetical protein